MWTFARDEIVTFQISILVAPKTRALLLQAMQSGLPLVSGFRKQTREFLPVMAAAWGEPAGKGTV